MDAAGRDWPDADAWHHQLCLQLLYFLGVWHGGDADAPSSVRPYDANAGGLF
ncbi:hypothetical protein D3C78_1795840 [compost metagenome]